MRIGFPHHVSNTMVKELETAESPHPWSPKESDLQLSHTLSKPPSRGVSSMVIVLG
jgi:hypothetical protein